MWVSPLFTALLEKRGFTDPGKIHAFFSADLHSLQDPFQMKGMAGAVELIRKSVRNRTLILVHGDYDVDGVTGTALMSRVLAVLGADFSTFLPHRSEDGYGVSARAIQKAHSKGARLLITVDCGITAHEQIALARSLEMEVIVIDHHRIPENGLPSASAILNPRQDNCAYAFKELSAAGLAFRLAEALLGPKAFDSLDLAALSTVCDVAPLIEENRVVVKYGLELLGKRANPGLCALSSAAGIKAASFNSGHLGFSLGPRINAAGRMSSPEIALRLLLTESPKEAESLAAILEEENKSRQKEEKQVQKEAVAEVERTFNFNRDRVIVAAREGWHPGVIGIVAARLVDQFHRPAVVIALEKGKGKGSGRSIKGFHLFNALDSCKPLFEEFGGHEQAAGLSILAANVAAFRARVNDYARDNYDPSIFEKKIPVDLEISFRDLGAGFVRELKRMEPHGAGNPRPAFLTRGLEIKTKPMMPWPQAFQFWLTDGVQTLEALWNDRAGTGISGFEKGNKIDLIYSLKTKTWNGQESLVLEVKQMIPSG